MREFGGSPSDTANGKSQMTDDKWKMIFSEHPWNNSSQDAV
jgi:hypothetical protein